MGRETAIKINGDPLKQMGVKEGSDLFNTVGFQAGKKS